MVKREVVVFNRQDQWFIPEYPGKGVPVFALQADPLQRVMVAVFSTREKCARCIADLFPGAQVLVEDDLQELVACASAKGQTLVVDLHNDGKCWDFTTFEPVVMTPGGVC